jgi:hypothetical protein
MLRLDPEEGRYRVLLIGIGANTEEDRGSFCRNLSKNYNIPFPLIKKIVDSSPIIVKKNIPFRKAETLAKTLRSFGARVSVEERKNLPPLSLEFQELTPHRLALESSSLRRGQRGVWSLTGRVRNISNGALSDLWVLVQLFEDVDEFVAFEETPLTINPLPSGEASPFKIIFEGDFSVKRISVAFKNASGHPIAAADERKKREWVEVPIGEEPFLSSPRMPPKSERKARVVHPTKPPEETAAVPPSLSPTLEPLEKVFESSLSALEEDGHNPEAEESKGALGKEPFVDSDSYAPSEIAGEIEKETDEEASLSHMELPSSENQVDETPPLDASVAQEAVQLPEGVSEIPPPSFPWIESFRNVVKTYYEKPHDDFSVWFEERRKGDEFKNSLHALLTLLVHSRFEQGPPSARALENTKRVFGLIAQPNLPRGDIPALEGTPFASGEAWTDLFHRALPKIEQIGNAILEKNRWSALDLERLVQVIPHMGPENSRKAVRWISELARDAVEVDFSGAFVTVGKGLYRVASRLGVVDPQLDRYEGPDSRGDAKIQSFAGAAFPDNPGKIEEPMACMGRGEEQGGHCFPIQPWCDGCLFETFCSRLCVDFDPSENGMKE